MVSIRPLRGIFVLILVISSFCQVALAQTATDTLSLIAPDSVTVRMGSGNVIIRWSAPHDSTSSMIGMIDMSNWIADYDPSNISEFHTYGLYTGQIDRSVRIERSITGLLLPVVVGSEPSIVLRIETIDPVNRTYSIEINIGTDHYIPGDPIPLILENAQDSQDLLDLGFEISFGPGIVDTNLTGSGAIIDMDLQDFEGFHVWRGLSPNPSEMHTIVELSKEDYFKISDIDVSGEVPLNKLWLWEYFRDTEEEAWPRVDEQGREWYEWVDRDVFPGFRYFYHVTCYDRGYGGIHTHNKKDNFICDEVLTPDMDPSEIVYCDDVAQSIIMTVDAGGDTDKEMMNVYAVPNPYRTGFSAETSPAYHNYTDRTIKFHNLPSQAEIRVYTVSGCLVWKKVHSSPDGSDGIASWNVKDLEGYDVGSGVYIFRVKSDIGSVYGRIVVIR